MIQISEGADILTIIQVFTVEPQDQQELIDLLSEGYGSSLSRAPGFLSCGLHRGVDGDKVTLYAQWRSEADYEAMLNDASLPAILYRALTISTFEPGRYEVMQTFRPARGAAGPA
ncbi:antibiotic biosynthesis monooxygenase family protein [Lichenicoccus roseus]|uniref:antibiotic biosynthesis monooxygenase family protein n=1 Tax=Lichenicoccus roseus TaxID=2683649 RepID=UPI001980C7BA|nr:antibiotic biosynthesis monooxygenase family protein [Lichenicoccus roseus]